jgi:CheY-like chemotaxis protein
VKTVLIVEDEPGISTLLTAALEDEGYRVVAAANGEEGLARLAETRPDVVVLDYMMPLLDGPSMARKMRRDPTFKDIPIVMMSAVGEGPVRERFDGYTGFLQKPFPIPALVRAVAQATAASRRTDEGS